MSRLHRVASKRSDAGRSVILNHERSMSSMALCSLGGDAAAAAAAAAARGTIVLCAVDHPTRDNSPERRVGRMQQSKAK